MRKRRIRFLATAALAVALAPAGLLIADPALAVQQTFVGYGYLPSDAHSAAVAQMQAYSSSCVELSTTYSGAGSEHYWKATLLADC